MDITSSTKVCAVIGDPVEHSLSPQIHNAAFRACDIDMVYVAFRIPEGHVDEAVDAVRVLGLRGLSVTIPHKVDIIPHLDDVEETTWKVGSVNTVINNNGRLKGYSTDGLGALRALSDYQVNPAGKRVLILGSGGAARAIAFALARLKNEPRLRILSDVGREAKKLALDLESVTGVDAAAGLLNQTTLPYQLEKADILIHATPVGMSPAIDQTLVPADLLRSDMAVFDTVYTPGETRLLREARQAGAKAIPGLGMFVHQAAIQFELWTQTEAPVDVMTETALEVLGDNMG